MCGLALTKLGRLKHIRSPLAVLVGLQPGQMRLLVGTPRLLLVTAAQRLPLTAAAVVLVGTLVVPRAAAVVPVFLALVVQVPDRAAARRALILGRPMIPLTLR
jgi:hypothetical protein